MFKAALPLLLLLSLLSCSSAHDNTEDGKTPVSAAREPATLEAKIQLPPWIQLGEKRTEPNGWHSVKEDLSPILSLTGNESMRYLVQDAHVRGIDIRLALEDELKLYRSYRSVFNRLENTYGQSQPSEHFATWKTAGKRGKLLEISLINGKELYSQDWLEIQWRVHEDKRYAN